VGPGSGLDETTNEITPFPGGIRTPVSHPLSRYPVVRILYFSGAMKLNYKFRCSLMLKASDYIY
jgi:hypothetical protein